jgi:hypothetical protein
MQGPEYIAKAEGSHSKNLLGSETNMASGLFGIKNEYLNQVVLATRTQNGPMYPLWFPSPRFRNF